MKKIILSISLGLIGTLTYAQGLDSIIVEKYYISNAADAAGSVGTLPVGSVTYRVYADLKAGYEFQAIYGEPSPLHTLLINTTTTFFNNQDRGKKAADLIGSSYLPNNSVALDSWFSVGGSADDQLGVLKSEDDGVANLLFPHTPTGLLTNSVSAVGIPLTVQDGNVAGTPEPVQFVGLTTEANVFNATSQAGNSFSTSNAAISSLVGSVGPTATNRVLIGQFTTDGIFHFELNIQIGLVTGGGVEKWVSGSPVGAEYTHSTLTYTSAALVANVLPTVSISAPATAATYTTGATVTMVATAADTDGSIDSVEFFIDGTKIGKDISSPYSYTLIATVGTHTLTAVATDNNGGQTTSALKTIIVSDPVIGISNPNLTESTSLNVYPNPTSDIVTIEINAVNQSVVSYSVYDVIGNQIVAKNLGIISGKNIEKLSFSAFSKGQYLLALTLDGVTSIKKIIVE